MNLKALGIGFAAAFTGFTLCAESALTIYNGNFAVVKDDVPLKLKKGNNRVIFDNVTALAEPDSVILSDSSGKRTFAILEQNYNSLTLSQNLLLSLFEGQTVDFLVKYDDSEKIVKGRVVRSGYMPPSDYSYNTRYGRRYSQLRSAAASFSPIIEVDGKVRFSLPGTPLFPPLTDKQKELLKPTVDWLIQSPEDISGSMNLSYITGGMSWDADYNLVMPENGGPFDLTGWVSIDNRCGKDFENVRVKLMAGDVNKIEEKSNVRHYSLAAGFAMPQENRVTEKKFDEYHLYTIANPVTLKDMENKQVEFISASGIKGRTVFIYDGMLKDPNQQNAASEAVFRGEDFCTKSKTTVSIVREFENNKENNLGIPLPKGKLRFYQRDTDGQIEFLGENTINHTPKDEKISVFTGNSFDLKGERSRTDYKYDSVRKCADEFFSIKLKNHKDSEVEITVVEHLMRSSSWEILENSDPFEKKDSNTIEFKVKIPADGEKTVKYKVHYSW